MDSHSSPLSPGGGAARKPAPHRTRTHVSKACEQCRRRKTKCTGETPVCVPCQKYSRPCVYSEQPDRRKLERIILNRLPNSNDNNHLSIPSTSNHSSNAKASSSALTPAISSPSSHHTNDTDQPDEDHPAWQPFGTGSLVLSLSGNLHLSPEATFYHPATIPPGVVPEMEGAGMDVPILPPYMATYLPFSLTEEDHTTLLDLCFETTASFGLNAFKDQFLNAMITESPSRGNYFSPLLHLSILAIGWRYCRDRQMVARYPNNWSYESRGQLFTDRAKAMVNEEAASPQLSTIVALILMTTLCVGGTQDQAACNFFSIGIFLVQDFRLHRRCDDQLKELGMEVGSPLDLVRRDVYGLSQNCNSWWATYYGRVSLPFQEEADQRRPEIMTTGDRQSNLISKAFLGHWDLSHISQRILFCNHTWKTPVAERIREAEMLRQELKEWKEELPSDIQWPPDATAPTMLPSIVTLHGLYAAHMILLHRPYILNRGRWSETIPDAITICAEATDSILEQCRYIRDFHGMHKAPLSIQHVIYVGGTILVLQAAGMHNIPVSATQMAKRNLSYLQRALDEFAEVWPAAGQTADSLRRLQAEYCLV